MLASSAVLSCSFVNPLSGIQASALQQNTGKAAPRDISPVAVLIPALTTAWSRIRLDSICRLNSETSVGCSEFVVLNVQTPVI